MYLMYMLLRATIGSYVAELFGYLTGTVLYALVLILGLSFILAVVSSRGPVLILRGVLGRLLTGLFSVALIAGGFIGNQLLRFFRWCITVGIPRIYSFFDRRAYSRLTGWLHRPLCIISTVLVIVIIII